MNVFRLPFRWERLQRTLSASLDSTELQRLDAVVALAHARNMQVILDLHNYGRYNNNVIAATASGNSVTLAQFQNLWQQVAQRYATETAIFAFALMNEPHDMNGSWPAAAQAAVDAIRAVDMTHTILVPGDCWSSAHRWTEAGCNQDLAITDPAHNFMYEAHVFFDKDHTGTYHRRADDTFPDNSYDTDGTVPEIGINRVDVFINWLKQKGVKGFIGEYGVPNNDSRWLTAMDLFLTHLDKRGVGAMYWAGGPWWGSTYALSVEPINGQDREQMAVLTKHLGRDRLKSGEQIDKEKRYLLSPDGVFHLVFQDDGNLVIYDRHDAYVWSASTQGLGGQRLVMQADGNLVILDSNNAIVWNSETAGYNGARLQLQEDGNLVIYSANGTALWSWGTARIAPSRLLPGQKMVTGGDPITSSHGRSGLYMQADGNLVVYNNRGEPIWYTATQGQGSTRLVMEENGNLVMYGGNDSVIWNSETTGYKGARLQIQEDNNLVIYSANGAALWSWITGRIASNGLQSGKQLIAGGDPISSNHGHFYLDMQADGNLVMYNSRAEPVWYTATQSGKRLVMEENGNLVVYDGNGTAVWSSNTAGYPGARLQLQEDSNLVIYSANGTALWSWITGRIAPNRLLSGQQMVAGGDPITSNHGHFRLSMQTDGNLVLYDSQGKPIWNTATQNPAGDHLVMGEDGNLILYGSNGAVTWSSGTAGYPGARLQLQEDSNLVIYSANGTALWSWITGRIAPNSLLSGKQLVAGGDPLTSHHGHFRLSMQTDGNLVLYDSQGKPIWNTATRSPAGDHLVMGEDGNLILYGSNGAVTWSSGTAGYKGARLQLQEDSNLVIYSANGTALWSWITGRIAPSNLPSGQQMVAGGEPISSPNGDLRLNIQADGNLVLSNNQDQKVWSTATQNQGGSHLVMQADGNLVILDGSHSIIWSSGTAGSTGAYLKLQNDGNLVVYSTDGSALWSWMTGLLATAPDAKSLQYMNTLRTQAGLNTYAANSLLRKMATNHANYIIINNRPQHSETAGDTGFTGATPTDRAAWVGYQGPVGEVYAYNFPTEVESVDSLMSAIYHRFGLLQNSSNEIGFSFAQTSSSQAFVGNNGNSKMVALCDGESFTGYGTYYILCEKKIHVEATVYEAALNYYSKLNPELVIWPTENATNVMPVFYEESPDPLPDYSVSGYPISAEFNTTKISQLNLVSFKLFNQGTGQQVTHTRLLDKSSDPNSRFSSHQFALFPLDRLNYNTTYRVELAYVQDGTSKNKSWTFTTKDLGTPVYTVTTNGSTFDVVSGQTLHVYIPPTQANPSIGSISSRRYSSSSTLNVDFADKNTLKITFTASTGELADFTFNNGGTFSIRIK